MRVRQRFRPLLGAWVSALPAADFAAFDEDFDARVFAAEDAAAGLVTLLVLDCARVLPAADLAALFADFEASVLLAAVAAFGPVRSDFGIRCPLFGRCR